MAKKPMNFRIDEVVSKKIEDLIDYYESKRHFRYSKTDILEIAVKYLYEQEIASKKV